MTPENLLQFTSAKAMTELLKDNPFLTDHSLALERISKNGHSEILSAISDLVAIAPRNVNLNLHSEKVALSGQSTTEFKAQLGELIQWLVPWRKGPFVLFGEEIDSEWRSNLKFNRLNLSQVEIRNKKICDVGCGNGYHAFRFAGLNPQFVLALEPTPRSIFQYLLVRSLIPRELNIQFSFQRDDALKNLPDFFDITFCLGVFYHHPNPKELIENLFISLACGGALYLETLYLEDNLNLGGEARYARMKNIHLIPSISTLKELLESVGFSGVEVTSKCTLTDNEQRTTQFAPGPSLKDFLDPEFPAITTEGFPRPERVIVRARKR